MENITLLSLANKYGCPLYVYDAERIVSQYQRLSNAFAGEAPLKINYATKALSNISVLKLLKSLGANLDCVSIGEVLLGLEAGYEPSRISFTPNGVSMKELEEIKHLGAKITIDNLYSLQLFGEKFPGSSVSIRINPQIMAGGNEKISVGHVNSKFGILKQHMVEVHEIANKTGININGVHMHTGSDILDVEIFLEGAEVLMDIAKQFKNLEFIDFGGGFKVPYKEGDKATNIELFAEKFKLRFNEFCKEYGKTLTMVFEPGKFLVSECGYFLAKVNLIKPSTNIVFAALDTGFNHLVRPMYYNAYHHITNISNPTGEEEKYNIVGYICETDTFAQDRVLPKVRSGDVLCFHNAGAYCFSMASNYNSRYLPAEILVYKGQDYLIRKAETFKDILRNQTKIELPL